MPRWIGWDKCQLRFITGGGVGVIRTGWPIKGGRGIDWGKG